MKFLFQLLNDADGTEKRREARAQVGIHCLQRRDCSQHLEIYAEAGSKLEPATKAVGRKTTPVILKVAAHVWLEKRK